MSEKRVVLTGMGTVNPMGMNVADTWKKVLAGESGIGPITHFDASNIATKIAGEIKDFDYKQYYTDEQLKSAKRADLFVHYGVAGMKEAVESSGLDIKKNPDKIGISFGSGIGGLQVNYDNSVALATKGPRRVSPFYIPMSIGNIAAGYISMLYGFRGPNLSTQTACATSNHAIAIAMMLIKAGMAEVMFAGGSEGTVGELAMAGFSNMRAISTRNDDPKTASRPYDKDRDGFVMSEGSSVLVLEDYEHAKARGANIICEIASAGMSGDAFDFVAPDPEGGGALLSMEMALTQAGLKCEDIDYINMHGTSTPVGDIAESKAVYKLLKGKQDNINVGSTKSMHGHLLGATAGLEAIICAMAIKEGKIPANINIENLDPEIPLTCINTEIVEKEVKVAMSNSFGFGGHNSTLILKKI
ncbi:MAG: beta-ketoacyl-ACP synthase II [Spirochaetia bacterium]|jgi:3-oxoacyl-[acyl-carrier-protein] synthase II|nr:beta-ketoacyl-ACP synthase II [Spirochaetia bacterium]